MLEKLKNIEKLPIFPLPVVLLPGMLMPLHIFEPRYRQMLHDCLQGGRLFGLTHHPESAVGTLVVPVVGSIGCAAHIMSVVPLPDERSNILAAGLCRYKTLEYTEQDPYLVARLEFFEDEALQTEIPPDLIQEVSDLFLRFLKAMRTLRDAPMARYALPADPEQLSFAIASAVLTEPEEQLEMLQMRSTEERFEFLEQRLDSIIDNVESQAEEHTAMRSNGRRKKGLGN
ncbi:MAG: LON peptidase substrate-binding domain-containing protein [Acidobacteria bacterium]|nr:LON peptidase substrate-binding domain-containing protein [Acidobacteriota bacterium]